MADFGDMVDMEMQDVLASRKMPFYDMMYYQLGWSEDPELITSKDRRHGVLCLLGALAADVNVEVVLPAAAEANSPHWRCALTEI